MEETRKELTTSPTWAQGKSRKAIRSQHWGNPNRSVPVLPSQAMLLRQREVSGKGLALYDIARMNAADDL